MSTMRYENNGEYIKLKGKNFHITFPDNGQIIWRLDGTTPSIATAICRTLIKVKCEASEEKEEKDYENIIEVLKSFLEQSGFPFQQEQ